MKKRNTVAVILAALLLCGSVSVYAVGGRRSVPDNDASATAVVMKERTEKAPKLTEEEKAAKLAEIQTALSEKLANGEITQEQYDEAIAKLEAGEMPFFGNGKGFGRINKGDKPERPEMPEFTEEQKAEMLEKVKTNLSEKLANGEITQEQYDEALAKLEAGEIPHGIRGRGIGFGGMEKPEKPELTEEQKTEMLEKAKTDLSEKLANGEITEEQYNERLEKLEAGELPFGHTVGKGFSRGKTPVRGFGGFEGRGNGFGRRPSEIPYDGEVEADEAEGEVVEVRADARKTFGGRNFGGMREDADVKL